MMTLTPYNEWECYQHGMYAGNCDDMPETVEMCRSLLASPALVESMRHVAFSWPMSAAQHLSQGASTYRPWLGHAACCFEFGAPNFVTKKAWHKLTPDEQWQANAIADRARKEWLDQTNGQDLFGTVSA